MKIRPIDKELCQFKEQKYPILGDFSTGYYLTQNDTLKVVFVKKSNFKEINEETNIDLLEDERDLGNKLPKIWLKKNRQILQNNYWSIGGSELYERIKTAKTLMTMGLQINSLEKQILQSDLLKIELFKESLKWIEKYSWILSDQYNPTFVNCIFLPNIGKSQFKDVFKEIYTEQISQEDQNSNWHEKTEVVDLSKYVQDAIKWHFDWLKMMTDFKEIFQKRQIEFKRINDLVLLNFITIIEDWNFNSFEMKYSYGKGCECRRLVIEEESGKYLILAFDNVIH